jgi:predicted RNA-binding protein associated with RNAse of E/G family
MENDLNLDIVILPPSDIHLLDKHELDGAIDTKVINEEQHNLACNAINRLMEDISNDIILLFKRYENKLKYLLKLIKE